LDFSTIQCFQGVSGFQFYFRAVSICKQDKAAPVAAVHTARQRRAAFVLWGKQSP